MKKFLSGLLRFLRRLIRQPSRTRPTTDLPSEVHFEHERSRGVRGN